MERLLSAGVLSGDETRADQIAGLLRREPQVGEVCVYPDEGSLFSAMPSTGLDLLLVSIPEFESRFLSTVSRIDGAPPIGVVADDFDKDVVIDAMASGARYFINLEDGGHEIESMVGRIAAERDASLGGRMQLVIAAGGGVGATTLSVETCGRRGRSWIFDGVGGSRSVFWWPRRHARAVRGFRRLRPRFGRRCRLHADDRDRICRPFCGVAGARGERWRSNRLRGGYHVAAGNGRVELGGRDRRCGQDPDGVASTGRERRRIRGGWCWSLRSTMFEPRLHGEGVCSPVASNRIASSSSCGTVAAWSGFRSENGRGRSVMRGCTCFRTRPGPSRTPGCDRRRSETRADGPGSAGSPSSFCRLEPPEVQRERVGE